jgi:hypothetical protein
MSRRVKPSKQVVCKNDEEINPKTGKCRKKCRGNEERHPSTGRCRTVRSSIKPLSTSQRVSPQRVSPQRVSPQRVSPIASHQRVSPIASPQRVSPQRVSPIASPQRVYPIASPQRVSPQRVSPQRVSPQPKQSDFYDVEDVIFQDDYNLYDMVENMINNVLQAPLYVGELSVEEITWKVSGFLEDLIEKIFTLQDGLPIVPKEVYKCLDCVPLGVVEYDNCLENDKKIAYIVKDIHKKLKNLPNDMSTPKTGCFHIPHNIVLTIMREKTSQYFGKTYQPSSFLRMFSRKSFVVIHTALEHFLTRLIINSSFSRMNNSRVFDESYRINKTANDLISSNRRVNIIGNINEVPFNNLIDKANKMLDNKEIENSFYQQWNFMLNVLSKHLIHSALQIQNNQNKIDLDSMRKATKLILQNFYSNIIDNENNNDIMSKLLPLPKLDDIELLSNEARNFLNLTLEYLTVEAIASIREEGNLSSASFEELNENDDFSKVMDNLKVYFVR